MKLFLKTYLLEIFLIWGAFGLYYLVPFAEFIFTEAKGLHFHDGITVEILFYLAGAYSVVAAYVVLNKQNKGEGTKLVFLLDRLRRKEYDVQFKNTLLFYLVKFFFIPLMVPSTVWYFLLVKESLFVPSKEFESVILYFNNYLFAVIVHIFTFLSLAYYSFGYLVESNYLGSKVKSVEPTVLGWVVTLICYIPFLTLVTRVLPFYTQDMAFFINHEVTFVMRIGLLLVMLFKVWSIATLGAKCSNLTNRGIVTSGPYKWVRHPHYLAKLIVWWVTFSPVFITDFWTISGMLFWTVVYILRAVTEENHLRSDEDYVVYCNQVKWRLIPYVF